MLYIAKRSEEWQKPNDRRCTINRIQRERIGNKVVAIPIFQVCCTPSIAYKLHFLLNFYLFLEKCS